MSALLREFSLPSDAVDRQELRLSIGRAQALPDAVAAVTGDSLLGLHVAASIPRGAYGLFEFAVRNAPSMGEMCRRVIRHNHLLDDLTAGSLETQHGETRFSLWIPGEPLCFGRQGNELVLGYFARLLFEVIPGGVSFRRVWFPHSEPADVSGLVSLFRTSNLEFDCSSIGVAFDPAQLARPSVGSDPALLAFLDGEADRLAASRPKPDALRARVLGQIRETIRDGVPKIDRVAAGLGLGPRTLQRRLEAGGIVFVDLVDEVRRDLAFIYVRDESMSIGEIAEILGYHKLGNFTRAFRRWTGMTPTQFRARR